MSLIRHGLFVLAMLVAGSAAGQGNQMSAPPAEWAAYLDKVKLAEAIEDPEQRCRAYPDLPGNRWNPPAEAICALLRKPELGLAEIDQRVRSPEGAAELEAHYQNLLEGHYAGKDQREQIFIAFDVFDASDLARKVADRWVGIAPKSAFARLASGRQYVSAAWDARGAREIADTSEEQILGMQTMVSRAAGDLDFALRANPRLLPACEGLMQVGQLTSDRVATAALSACLKSDPDSYFVVRRWIWDVQPKWGGSMKDLRKAQDYAMARTKRNPLLGRLASQVAAYTAYESGYDTDWKSSVAELEAAMAIAPDPTYLRFAGIGAHEAGDHWKAVVLFSQSVRFSPKETNAYLMRGRSRLILRDFTGAIRDGETALGLRPKDGANALLIGDGHKFLRNTGLAREAYRKAMNDPKTRGRGFHRWCTSFFFSAADVPSAEDCTRDLVAEYPESGEAWRMRVWVLEKTGSPDLPDAARNFLRYADLSVKSHRETAQKLKVAGAQ